MSDLKGLAPKSTSVGVKTVTSKVDSASSFSSVTSEHFHGPVSRTFSDQFYSITIIKCDQQKDDTQTDVTLYISDDTVTGSKQEITLSYLWLRDVERALVVDGGYASPQNAALRGDLAGVSSRLDGPGGE